MVKKFGFAESEDPASDIIVEFFDDQYEEEMAAVQYWLELEKSRTSGIVDFQKILPQV